MVIRVRIRRRVRKPKPGFFTLKAEPRLWQDGPLRGFLDYVIFTAHTTKGLHLWHAHRHGNFIDDFSALVSEEEAIDIVRDLHSGQSVELAGRHRLELLQGRFGFN